MGCQTIYDEMMSLQLDGLLDAEGERHLLAHIAGCGTCAPFWDAMKQADTLLIVSSHEPVVIPPNFTLKVMVRVAQTSVVRPQIELEVGAHGRVPLLASEMPRSISVLPPMTSTLEDYEALPQVHMPEYVQEWQSRIAAYVRGMTAVGLSILGAAGVVLAAIITGSLQVDGPIAPVVQIVRGFISAADTWARSLLSTIGSDVAIGGTFALALIAIAGWQIVSNYHHSTSEHWLDAAVGEAA